MAISAEKENYEKLFPRAEMIVGASSGCNPSLRKNMIFGWKNNPKLQFTRHERILMFNLLHEESFYSLSLS